MNIQHFFYNSIRTISIAAIVVILSIGFVLPISFTQALVINPMLLVSLMIAFVISSEKLKSANQLADVVHLPQKSKCKFCAINKAA